MNRLRPSSLLVGGLSIIAFASCQKWSFSVRAAQEPAPAILIISTPPSELNPESGGAPKASPDQAAEFAWQEFIALNWPAGPQNGQSGQRGAPSSQCHFGDPNCSGPLVWETFRGKVEIFPGNSSPVPGHPGEAKYGPPPGYPGSNGDSSFGYDALPQYNYQTPVPACDVSQKGDPVPWINLDETDQITLDNMYAGVVDPDSSPGNSSPQLVRFLAKANRTLYVYVTKHSSASEPDQQWWGHIPNSIVENTKNYLSTKQASPPPDSGNYVSLPYGTIEIKAAWRPLNANEAASGRFHLQTVRFYGQGSNGKFSRCYRDAIWGLVALHIIQKTPSAPYFIYATFEQADNILTADGKPIEDVDGNVTKQPQTPGATAPQICLIDPKPPASPPPPSGEVTSADGSVIITNDPKTCTPVQGPTVYCGAPGKQLYMRNVRVPLDPSQPPSSNSEPNQGTICIGQRENLIPDYVIRANSEAHSAIAAYLHSSGISTSPWLYYKLVNVQYYPYNKMIISSTPNGSLYTSQPPYTATNPSPSSFYQANVVVETNRSLQLFSGGLSPNISSDWNMDGTAHKNTYYGGHFYNMGGCMGCHGSQGQIPQGMAGDFSVILARGTVVRPEIPSIATSEGMTTTSRNRSIAK